MSVYLAKPVGHGAQRSQAFAAKSIPNFTMTTLSNVPQQAKAASVELAFSGYKDSIEAFLYATALNTRVNSQAGFFPLPHFDISIPLNPPPIVFRLPKKVTTEQHRAILEHFKKSEIKALPEASGPQGYVVTRPDWNDYLRIEKLGIPQTSSPGDCIQVIAIPSLRTLYRCIELFLRVNTYYYRRADALARIKPTQPASAEGIDSQVLVLYSGSWTLGDKKRKATEITEDSFNAARSDASKWEDTITHKSLFITGGDAVLVAKPSPKPYQASCGSPRDVPNEPGLLFPYFQGMLTCDTSGLRSIVSKLFFRNFGDVDDSDARRGFQEFRNVAGIIASSPAGPILGHLLKGFEMALDAQAHCFLLMDDDDYLGFVLLGDHFYVHNGTGWVEPMGATDLRAELQTIATHETTLGAIVEALAVTKDYKGAYINVEAHEIAEPCDLLTTLSYVDESQSDMVKELGRLIKALRYKGGFLEVGPRTVVWALSMLGEDRDASLEGRNLFIPLSDWKDCGSREFQVFAAFGPRAFHFLNRRGTRFPIPKTKDDLDLFASKSGEPPSPTYPHILVYPCVVTEAVNKWRELEKTATLILDVDERAGGSRAMRWSGESLDLIWSKLKELASNGVFSKSEKKEEKKEPRGTKRAVPDDFDVDAILGI